MDGQWTALSEPFAWFALAGGIGGVVNAIVSHNLFLWPSRVLPVKIVRPGLALNIVIGGCASLAAVRAFGGADPAVLTAPAGDLALALVGALFAGILAARWMTNETDTRLLRAAVSRACAAPAAHPDTTRAMEMASPYEVFQTAKDLVPRFRSFP
jgi:hypothetical protein